jgi:ABC-type multidrug transport system ATPase subunit
MIETGVVARGVDDAALLDLRTLPLVELTLERITLALPTRSAAAASATTKTAETRRTTILSDVTTAVAPYRLSAWMGPSGCGKTSLLSVAAGLLSDPDNELVGDSRIKINDGVGSAPKRMVGVVWQDDMLLSNLTVRETVRFAARMKNTRDVSDEMVETVVDDTLSKLGLSHVGDHLIGVPGGGGRSRGISGGQRKRVAVAVELVARPSILLLDEPTSGLDASTAYQLMVTLKSLALIGHSIAVVIHQPRTSIFNMFDNLLLLSQGRVVYEGGVAGARHFLQSCGVGELPPETGIADWIMDVIIEDEKKEGGGTLPLLWESFHSKEQQRLKDQIVIDASHNTTESRSQKLPRRLSTLEELEKEGPKYQSSFWIQLKFLTIRAAKQQRGQHLTVVAFLVTFCWTAFTCLAWGRMPDTTAYVFNRASLLFFLIIGQSNSVVSTSLVTFSAERRLLSRERAKKMYRTLPYFIAMTLSDMIHSVTFPTLYGVIVYWICNFRPTAHAFFVFVLTLYLTISAAQVNLICLRRHR